ncbi:5-formyltetrahydrofolate cyclo-ligase [Alkalinema sp. FACHB-956]|uniref:5-formyltetrahydrofolate cyclo-ligase n=1 Tax=Alkalinema sp. FACHB-956 TaxID=2692768 RepID=UPI001689676C|nr:5-formyltetrahydrofolate cyclo-ligase [Alkalinema sp. FACHB-956]MBD2327712.1 5-formyltetrahydrofolate cyclo-ligase [Alkalinema sp. FACHB-956]
MQTELTKVTLRQQLLQQRQALTPADWQQRSQQICQQVQRSPQFQAAQTVLAFFAVRQEPDLRWLWQENCDHSQGYPPESYPPESHTPARRFGFPRCQGQSLVWHLWQPGQPLVSGRFGIQEPDPTCPQLCASEVDLILVPCLAIDAQGYRLGYGGGFYDRLFSQPDWRSIPAIGICFDFGYCDRLPHDAWDQPLQGVCTESQQMTLDSRLRIGSD